MTPMTLTLEVAAATFTSALFGLWLRRVLPEHHLSDQSRDVVRISIGLVVTMTGLILGLVVSSAKSTFDSADVAVQQGATNLLTLDRSLRLYGPETRQIRAEIRQMLDERIAATWPELARSAATVDNAEVDISVEQILSRVLALKPATETQQWLRSQALELVTDQEQKLWLRMERQDSPAGRPFSIVLTAWLVVIFLSFGLFAPRHATGIGTLLICSASVAAAIFLIAELDHPYQGMIKVSPQPLQFAHSQLGR